MRLLLPSVVVLALSTCLPSESTCPAETTRCDGACVDLSSSTTHCGACGAACGSGESCVSGACVSGCQLPSGFVAAGTTDGCLTCDPARSATALSPRDDGASCTTGLCHAGACETACFIAGVIHADGALNPANPCERCEATASTSAWTTRADGVDCGNAQRCEGGSCGAGCFIDGVLRATDAVNPANACEHCAPGTSTSAWSSRVDGSACGAGQVCGDGACASRCFIAGELVDAGTLHDGCEQCVPAQSTTAWAPLADGTACGVGQICAAGACASSCFVGAQVVDAGVLNAQNACEVCAPSTSTTDWSARADGASCGSGVCESAACVDKCFIGGQLLDAGTLDATNLCRACLPALSASGYSPLALSTLLSPGDDLVARGWNIDSSGPHSLVDDGGVIVLSTSPNGTTSGHQLLSRRISADGGAFTLRVELRVDAVNPHNPADSAAAILGRFTGPFGTPVDRAQMVYLDAVNVGWADDTQASAVGNLDGGFHVYELSVDADAGATFSVDGVARLSRSNFTTNGVIAIGDQTNDPNVDSTLSLRSVTLVCQ